MDPGMFIVRHGSTYYGPFLAYETASFVAKLEGPAEVLPLVIPSPADEDHAPTPVRPRTGEPYSAFIDRVRVDTKHTLAGISQERYFARRDARVLTAREMREMWDQLLRVTYAVESLMHHADVAVADPQPAHLEALRQAIWRNRDSDDVDLHYADRFW